MNTLQSSSIPPPIRRVPNAPPIFVLFAFALVVVGALIGSALFFTAGLVLVPVLVVATAIYVMSAGRTPKEPPGPPSPTSPSPL